LSFCDFRWNFLVKRCSDSQSALILRDHLICPLLFLGNFLSHEVEELRNVVENKDELIHEFRTRRTPSKKMLPWGSSYNTKKFSQKVHDSRWSESHNAFGCFPSLYGDYLAVKEKREREGFANAQSQSMAMAEASSSQSQSLYSQELGSPFLGSPVDPPSKRSTPTSSGSSQSNSTKSQKKEKAVVSPPPTTSKGQTEKERKRELKRKLEMAPEKEARKKQKVLPKII